MYCHLNHDMSLLSKVICVSIFWDVATGCYCNMHFPPPLPSILYCFQVVTFSSSLCSFLPPSSSVSPSGNVPAPLTNRRKNTSWFLYLVLMKQSTALPSFQADHLQINLVLYMPRASDLCNNPSHEEASCRDCSPSIHVLLYFLNICWISSKNGSVDWNIEKLVLTI